MKFEILDSLPVSGEFDEHKYEANGDCLWVKFFSATAKVVGVFGKGAISQSSVTLFNYDRSALVLASGQGYIIDLGSMVLAHKSAVDFLTHAIAIPDTQIVAVGDFWSVRLYSPQGLVWEALNIANDELKIDNATKEMVSGKFWSGNSISTFELNISAVILNR